MAGLLKERLGHWVSFYPEPILLIEGGVVRDSNAALSRLIGADDPAFCHGQSFARVVSIDAQRTDGVSWLSGTLSGPDAEVPVEALLLPLNAGKDARQHLVYLRDRRPWLEREETLHRAKLQAEMERNSARQFLAQMTHELRTPLNAVIGFSEIMVNQLFGALDDRYRDYAEDIMQSGRHLLGIINDILDLSKIEAGEMVLDERQVDIGRVVQSSIRILSERAAMGQVSIQVDPACIFPLVIGDETKLKQLFLNLLSNAVKFTPSGGRVLVRSEIDSRGWLAISVIDTGIGMSVTDSKIAMMPFKQLHAKTEHDDRGTGLGLTISQAIAVLHNGTLELVSEVGKGTRVTLKLPADRLMAVS
ncbi:MAG: HAMP domain-containing sensor histidine kinase [Oceanibaculum nanhaiense]|mgnify:CR=1 FL=1|jgi:signal transduction histidine kinase|uniref:sensor histidine kinase n=1 Tax=Oceanibaculum nanhaiense TaxID=1909734 RepID=UPI0032EAA4DE